MRNILVVDNVTEERNILVDTLKNFGLNVIGEAENGLVAYNKYRELQPDLVTMNLNMPVLDGLDSTKKIIDEFPDAKIIIASYQDNRMLISDAILNGATDYYYKKDSLDILKTKLFKALNINI